MAKVNALATKIRCTAKTDVTIQRLQKGKDVKTDMQDPAASAWGRRAYNFKLC
jgi:hypothetical protein